MKQRKAEIERCTKETEISARLNLDGTGTADVVTGIGFLDHLLDTLAKHARFDLDFTCKGDLFIDDHHTAEDCGLTLGMVLQKALGPRMGIRRFGYAYAPLDEALARAVVDISGRPFADLNLGLTRDKLGELSCENIPHILSSFASTAGITIHVDVLKGKNDHHRAEAAFKALALAIRSATQDSGFEDIPSTKGDLGGTEE